MGVWRGPALSEVEGALARGDPLRAVEGSCRGTPLGMPNKDQIESRL
jgi:hypothetical protein